METNHQRRSGKWLIIILIIGLAALAFYFLRPQSSIPRAAEALSAQHTVVLGGAQRLSALYERMAPILSIGEGRNALIDALFGSQEARRETMGFDPAKPEGWRSIGLDEQVGLSVAFDERLSFPGPGTALSMQSVSALRPIILCRITDEAKLLQYVEQTTGIKGTAVTEQGMDGLTFGPITVWKGTKNGLNVLMASGDSALKTRFETFLSDDGPSLDENPTYVASLPEKGDGTLGFIWFDFGAMSRVVGQLGLPEPLLSTASFYTTLFPASSMILSEAETSVRVMASEDGKIVLRQLFEPRKSGPKFARLFPESGWMALRWTINLNDVLNGIGRVLPPAVPDGVRKSVGLARMLLPLTIGVSWENVARAFSGHFIVASQVPGSPADLTAQKGWKNWFLATGIGDTKVADRVIGKLLGALSKKTGIQVALGEMGGNPTWTLSLQPFEFVAHRANDVLLVGFKETVEVAANRVTGKSLTRPEALKVIDGENVFGFWMDLAPLLKPDGALASLIPEQASSSPVIAIDTALDSNGARIGVKSSVALGQVLEAIPAGSLLPELMPPGLGGSGSAPGVNTPALPVPVQPGSAP